MNRFEVKVVRGEKPPAIDVSNPNDSAIARVRQPPGSQTPSEKFKSRTAKDEANSNTIRAPPSFCNTFSVSKSLPSIELVSF